jgi:hypothetical protein
VTDINVTMTPVIVQVSENTYTIDMSSVGAQGAAGSAGQINSVSATTLAAGSSATVVNNGSTTNAQLVFGIPRGNTGDTGAAATVQAGTATGLPTGSAPTVTNSGSTSAATFNFGIPAGAKGDTGTAATATAGSTTTGAAGTNATVVNSGSTSAAVFDFTIPRGNTGAAATATAGTTTTGPAGTNATVTNTGTTSAAVFDFVIPRGNTGATGQGFTYRNAWVSGTSYNAYDVVTYSGSTYVCILAVSGTTIPPSDTTHWTLTASKGDTGTSATVAAGTTTTGAAGTNASVSNSGSSSAAVFDFTIPRGNTGATGQGYTARGLWNSATTYAAYDVVYYNGSTYYALQSGTNQTPSNRPTYWSLTALGINTPVTWIIGDTYYPGDTVTRLGSTYYCIAQSTGNTPPNATYWQLLASKGDTGATGPQGPTGNWDYFAPASGMDIMPRSISGLSRSLGNNFMYVSWFVALNSFTCSSIQVACSIVGVPAAAITANKTQVGLYQPSDSGGNYSPTSPTNAKCLAIGIKSNTGTGGMAALGSLSTVDTFNLGFIVTGTSGSYVTTGSATPISIVAGQTYGIGVVASGGTNGFTTAPSVTAYATAVIGNSLPPYMCGTTSVPATAALANDITVNQLFTTVATTGNSSTPWARLS